MKMLIVILLSLFVCTQGCAQTDCVEHNKGKNMKRYFDIKTFNENQNRAGYYEWGADVHRGKVPLRIEKEKRRAKKERDKEKWEELLAKAV